MKKRPDTDFTLVSGRFFINSMNEPCVWFCGEILYAEFTLL